MICITGDTHIPVNIAKLSTKRFPQQKSMTAADFLIICGDFGGVWDNSGEQRYWLRWLNDKNFTTLFVDGNHENFDLLGTYPEESFRGGRVHRVGEKILHLMRGQVYDLDGMRIFTFGGAQSHDREFRKEGKNWWKAELPTEDEITEARQNLDRVGWQVDLVVTHCAPSSIQRMMDVPYGENVLTDFFDELRARLTYEKWYFGHYHRDVSPDEKHRCVFKDVVEVV